jgi:hypothetical protein
MKKKRLKEKMLKMKKNDPERKEYGDEQEGG